MCMIPSGRRAADLPETKKTGAKTVTKDTSNAMAKSEDGTACTIGAKMAAARTRAMAMAMMVEKENRKW